MRKATPFFKITRSRMVKYHSSILYKRNSISKLLIINNDMMRGEITCNYKLQEEMESIGGDTE